MGRHTKSLMATKKKSSPKPRHWGQNTVSSLKIIYFVTKFFVHKRITIHPK
ncbi:hypothetical protein Patl1_02027 [Pistacia atlantica]|uniref:Uncharacterized protein n=1 Tax=Pistacia atlantica TaxID=434234 RepID=A0ACC1C855_9ROSI|nr:hypothetical protein Patl1_02027 [Pistacia atlantica]